MLHKNKKIAKALKEKVKQQVIELQVLLVINPLQKLYLTEVHNEINSFKRRFLLNIIALTIILCLDGYKYSTKNFANSDDSSCLTRKLKNLKDDAIRGENNELQL